MKWLGKSCRFFSKAYPAYHSTFSKCSPRFSTVDGYGNKVFLCIMKQCERLLEGLISWRDICHERVAIKNEGVMRRVGYDKVRMTYFSHRPAIAHMNLNSVALVILHEIWAWVELGNTASGDKLATLHKYAFNCKITDLKRD